MKEPSPPIRQQYLRIKRRYPNAIVLFRLGDFYETFDEDARITSRELEIVLTSREMGKGNRVPLAGIPYHALDGYLAKLINRGYKVAICEQMTKPGEMKGMLQREVVRLVTPGTVVEPGLLDSKSNNYLVSVVLGEGEVGLAYVDITTSEFATTQLPLARAVTELERLNPSEVIASESADIDALGTLRLLEAVRLLDYPVHFYQASSSEMFGQASETPQTEHTPFHPRSPYGVAKVYSYWQTINYREAYGLFACNGILFNHESPRRGGTFVTRKITQAATRIKLGLQDRVFLGNLDAQRDWGFAGDFVKAMWLMLQQDQPDDYVIATGERHSVREFCEKAFGLLDLDWEAHVGIDPRYLRPTEVDVLQGDASKARQVLGWEPTVTFDRLVEMMVEADLELAHQEKALVDAGLRANSWRSGRGH